MTLEDLINSYRAQSLDTYEPFLADNELLGLYASEAQVEACRRAQLLVSTVKVTAEPGAQDIAMPADAIRIIRASVDGGSLDEITADAMDAYFPGWDEHENQSQPRYLITGVNTGRLSLWPRPAAQCSIRLTLQMLPSKSLANCNDVPVIPAETHPALVEWMLYKVYSRTDSDLADPSKAAIALRNFEVEFGRKASGRNEAWVRQGDGMMPGPIA